MVNDLSANNTMNILKELITYINLNVPIKKEFEYIIEAGSELIDIYFNESNDIRAFYKTLNDKIILKNSIILLKELTPILKDYNTLPENINNNIAAVIQLTDLYYASNN